MSSLSSQRITSSVGDPSMFIKVSLSTSSLLSFTVASSVSPSSSLIIKSISS